LTEAKRGRMAKAIVNFMIVVWSVLRVAEEVEDRTCEVDEGGYKSSVDVFIPFLLPQPR
jgi:hypothetical protein